MGDGGARQRQTRVISRPGQHRPSGAVEGSGSTGPRWKAGHHPCACKAVGVWVSVCVGGGGEACMKAFIVHDAARHMCRGVSHGLHRNRALRYMAGRQKAWGGHQGSGWRVWMG